MTAPTLDIAQGGFREAHRALGQTLCIVEICSILRRYGNFTSILAHLDIKSAYDTVDRTQLWNTLQSSLPPAPLGILKHLFDDVQIEVLLQNATY
jgi:hypothetical protein